MIAHLRGKLLAKHPNQAVVETAGVGYDVTISVPTFSDLPAIGRRRCPAHSHARARRHDRALRISAPDEKVLFEKLITVSGIGPKLAITILSGMAADEMVGAIRGNDVARLTRIPGIGKKTAERMVLELRDKLPRSRAKRRASDSEPERDGRRCALGAGEFGLSTRRRRKGFGRRGQRGECQVLRSDVPGSPEPALKIGRFLALFYFPMQKVLKIKFRMSSVVVAPVIASSGRSAV